MHHKKFNKVLTRLTQNNPVLISTRYYKLKYLPVEYPVHYKDISYEWAGKTSLLAHPSVTMFLPLQRFILLPTNRYSENSNTCISKVMRPNAKVLQLYRSFSTHNNRIKNSSHQIPSHLTQPVQHINYHLQLFPTITCPQCIYLKGLIPNPPWHINHTSWSRTFSSRGLSTHKRKYLLFAVTSYFINIQTLIPLSNNFLPSDVKKASSLIPSLYMYLGSFYRLLLSSFQLTVTSFSIALVSCLEIWRVF